ncbi:uncharacterized protein LOC62_04G005857 [Vanrija pseudolonga]|uniref:Uncharacterized protein n=1 Tax=Vanrija pseudolonga TaxID=143232 RepID=A0AAF1BRL8_9TREE|nr:hypothetical protein LOC62_04G005857 [Vanrija pseudolonga]
MSWCVALEVAVRGKSTIRYYYFPNPYHRFGMAASFTTAVETPWFTPVVNLSNLSVSDDDVVKAQLTVDQLRGMAVEDMQRFRVHKPAALDYPEAPVPVPAKFIGLWLGDGNRANTGITNNHQKEIIDYLHEICGMFDLHLKYYSGVQYGLTSGTRSSKALPETKDAEERGELEPRLRRREMKELMDEGYTRVRRGDDGYKAKKRRLGPASSASTSSTTPSIDGAPPVPPPSTDGIFEDVDIDDNVLQSKKRFRHVRRIVRKVSQHEADDIADNMLHPPAATSRSFEPDAHMPTGKGCNRLLTAMKNLKLIYDYRKYGKGPARDSKRVPPEYMFNSRAVRQDLLAGLIDADDSDEFSINIFQLWQTPKWHMGRPHVRRTQLVIMLEDARERLKIAETAMEEYDPKAKRARPYMQVLHDYIKAYEEVKCLEQMVAGA